MKEEYKQEFKEIFYDIDPDSVITDGKLNVPALYKRVQDTQSKKQSPPEWVIFLKYGGQALLLVYNILKGDSDG